ARPAATPSRARTPPPACQATRWAPACATRASRSSACASTGFSPRHACAGVVVGSRAIRATTRSIAARARAGPRGLRPVEHVAARAQADDHPPALEVEQVDAADLAQPRLGEQP